MYKNKQELVISNKNMELSQNNYKEIWNKVDELIFVIEVDEEFVPKCFIDSNSKMRSVLGYSKGEFIKTPPSDILNFDKNEINLKPYSKLMYKKRDKVEIILKSKDNKHIYVKATIIIYKHDQKNYILNIATDITKNKKSEKQISGILMGIPDVIKVFNPDHTIAFFNDAGYSFYDKAPEEIKGKKCYEILRGKEKCINCSFDIVMRTKKMFATEKYISELNKFMDVCCNPVLDEYGEILYVVERLRDISEKKMLDKILKDSKDRYKQILNSSPDAIIIIVDNKIVLANYEACNLIGSEYSEVIDSNIYKYFQEKYRKVLLKRFRTIILEKKQKNTHDYEFNLTDGKLSNLQISCSYILYEGNSAILAVMRDITEMKEELNKAADFQRKTLQKDFPAKEFIDVTSLYVPAKTISGDFYRIYKINENLIIGIIVDVRGKGISAALNISAFDILFLEEVAVTHEAINIVNNLNKKLVNYYEENYIAVCCFSMDFNKNEINIVGAGINQFFLQKKDEKIEEKTAEGIFLGMFEDSEFEEQIISFESGDKFIFFTDGLDFIMGEDKIIQRHIEEVSISEFKNYINELLTYTILESGTLKDDCTMLAIEIK